MYGNYENIVTEDECTLTQVNALFWPLFALTSNPACKCYFVRQLKQRHDETTHEFYIRLEEQGQKRGFTGLNREI